MYGLAASSNGQALCGHQVLVLLAESLAEAYIMDAWNPVVARPKILDPARIIWSRRMGNGSYEGGMQVFLYGVCGHRCYSDISMDSVTCLKGLPHRA